MSDPLKGVALESARVRHETAPRLRRAASRHFELYLELFGTDGDGDLESIPPFRAFGSLWEALTSEAGLPERGQDAARSRSGPASTGSETKWGIDAFPEVFLGREKREQAQKVQSWKPVNLARRLSLRFT